MVSAWSSQSGRTVTVLTRSYLAGGSRSVGGAGSREGAGQTQERDAGFSGVPDATGVPESCEPHGRQQGGEMAAAEGVAGPVGVSAPSMRQYCPMYAPCQMGAPLESSTSQGRDQCRKTGSPTSSIQSRSPVQSPWGVQSMTTQWSRWRAVQSKGRTQSKGRAESTISSLTLSVAHAEAPPRTEMAAVAIYGTGTLLGTAWADQPLEQWILFSTIHQLGCASLYTPPPRDGLFGLRMLAPPPSL